MGFSVNTNAGALVALRYLNETNRAIGVAQNRINTGLKVSGAKDNAAVFAIAQKQRAELAGYSAVKASLNRAISATNVAIAGAEAVSDILIRMKEIAIAAKDPSNDDASRAILDLEFSQLAQQTSTIVESAEFNGRNALKSDDIKAITSPDADSSSVITISASTIDTQAALLDLLFSIDTQANATGALAAVEGMVGTLEGVLSKLGAGAKRLEIAQGFTQKISDTIEIGIGKLVDADLAREAANLQALQVKQQLGLQALAIANQTPIFILALFA